MSTSAEPHTAPQDLTERGARFAREVIRPRAAEMARGDERSFPRWLLTAAADAGLAGMLLPREHGGAGATHVEFAGFVEAVARECASSAVILDVQLSVAAEPVVQFGTPAQRARVLPRLAGGEWLGAFALSEPGSGSDAASLQTRAERTAGGWRLHGTKMWITNAGAADICIVLARTGGTGARGISAFLVETSRPGVRAGTPLRKMGLRGSWTAELILDGVEVPADALLGDEGQGFRIAMAALDSGRIGISAQATGIAQGALDTAAAHVRAHGVPPWDEAALLDDAAASSAPQWVGSIAGMAARVEAARALTMHAAALCDARVPFTRTAAAAKLVATDAAVAVAQEAATLCAPESAGEWHPAAVRLRDAKACQIYEGTNQIQRMVIARDLLR